MYRPPSGAVPAKSASTNVMAGDWPRLLIHCMRLRGGGLGPDWNGPPLFVDRDEDDFRLGDQDALAMAGRAGHHRGSPPAFGFNDHPDGDRRASDPDGLGVEVDDIPEKHGLVELDFAH